MKMTNSTLQAIAAPQLKAKKYKTILDSVEQVLIDNSHYYDREPITDTVNRIVKEIRKRIDSEEFAKGAAYGDCNK